MSHKFGTLYLTGSFGAVGNSNVAEVCGEFVLALWGTFVGTVIVEASPNEGTTWVQLTLPWTTTLFSATAPGVFVLAVPDRGWQVRARCSAYTSGTINYRLGGDGAR